MDNPPPTPGSKPPLGRAFFIWLLAPLASMAIAAAASASGGHNSNLEGFGIFLSLLSLLAMLVCSVVCSVMIGKRHDAAIGVVAFIGIQILYIAVACAGCAVTVGKVNFH